MIVAPVRFDRMRRALFAALSDALGAGVTLKWSRDSVQRDLTMPAMVVLSPMGGLAGEAERSGGRIALSPDSVSYTLDSVAVGERHSLYLNDYAYRHDVAALETIEDVRDALLAQISADAASPYTAVAVGTDEIVVTATPAGSIWETHAMPASRWTVVQGVTQAVIVTQRQVTQRISIGCYSKSTTAEGGALSLAAIVRAALRMHAYQEDLDNAGVSLMARSPVVDLSAIAGAAWETRCSFDLDVGLAAVTSELVDTIEDVTITTTYEGADGSTILETEYTTPAV